MASKGDRVKALELGERYVRAGKIEEAIGQFEQVAALDPEDSATLNMIGDLYSQSGEKKKAVEAFLRAAEVCERKGLFTQALAIYRKIYKLAPDNPDFCSKLGDLLTREGFVSEAKKVYKEAADEYWKKNNLGEATKVLEKAVMLDREDIDLKKKLATSYSQQGYVEAYSEQMNDIAEILLANEKVRDAREILDETYKTNPASVRTINNLVTLFRREGRFDKATNLIEEKLKENTDDNNLLNLLGNLLFDSGQVERAEAIFSRILNNLPQNVNARVKLSRIAISKGQLDLAYDILLPLVDNLFKKRKEEKAIGLLGLILEANKFHLPTLERLATIYKANKDKKKLEVVLRVIYRGLKSEPGDHKNKMLSVLQELRHLCPDDEEVKSEYMRIRRKMGLPYEEVKPETVSISEYDRKMIQETIEQAELYMQQGLVRNARRILENLKLRYPEEPRIMEKIAILDQAKTLVDEEELRRRVEKASRLESKIKDKSGDRRSEAGKKAWLPFPSDVVESEKISTAEIFADTGIIPFMPSESKEIRYQELQDRIGDELRMIKLVYREQTQGDNVRTERDLKVIVDEFRRDLKTKVKADDYDTHFNLGIAFMEQGLYDEAIEEFSAASRDRRLAVDCFSLISYSFKQKKKFHDAHEWLRQALSLVNEGTEQYYALRFDLAELLAESENKENALSLFREILVWNPRYRNISKKMEYFSKKDQ